MMLEESLPSTRTSAQKERGVGPPPCALPCGSPRRSNDHVCTRMNYISLGPFSSRFSPRLPGPSTPSLLVGEGGDGGEAWHRHATGLYPALSQSCLFEAKSENRISENQWFARLNFPVFGNLRQSRRRRSGGRRRRAAAPLERAREGKEAVSQRGQRQQGGCTSRCGR